MVEMVVKVVVMDLLKGADMERKKMEVGMYQNSESRVLD